MTRRLPSLAVLLVLLADYPAIEVMNTILGGSFSSRLNQNLRETKGYTTAPVHSSSIGQSPGLSSLGPLFEPMSPTVRWPNSLWS